MFPARFLIKAVTSRIGRLHTRRTDSAGEWQLAHHTLDRVDTLLAEQTAAAYASAVDHGHELTLLLADTARATTIDHTPTASPHQDSEPHRPVAYFAEAGSGACPHGDSPHTRHTGCDEDVLICLASPIGDHCPGCQDTAGEPVPWILCPYRPTSGDSQDGGKL